MADNLQVSTGTDATVRTKDNAGVHLNVAAIADTTGANIAAVSAAGRVSVDGSGVTQPVSGTVTAAAQPGVDIGDVTVNNGAGAAAVNIQDGGNSLTVDGTVSVTGVATEATLATLLTSSQLIDDTIVSDNAAFTDGTTKVDMAGFVFDETAGTALTENDAAAARIDSKRAQVMVMEDATTRGRRAVLDSNGRQEIAILGGATVGSASVLTIAPGAAEPGLVVRPASLPALVAGTANIGDVDVLTVPMALDGSSRTIVVGTVAHDSPVGSSSPVQVGVEARIADGTPVSAAGDLVRPIADTLGKQVVLVGSVHDRRVSGTATFTNTTAADVIAAQGAGVKIVIDGVTVTNAHATTGTKVEIRDGTTVKVQQFAAAAGGGWSRSGIHFTATANTAVTARCVTTGADVDVSLSGYTISN